jgi:hypothetical protein
MGEKIRAGGAVSFRGDIIRPAVIDKKQIRRAVAEDIRSDAAEKKGLNNPSSPLTHEGKGCPFPNGNMVDGLENLARLDLFDDVLDYYSR